MDLGILRGKTVLVTGSSGLVGTYLLACLFRLRQLGVDVRVYAHMLSDPPDPVAEMVQEGHFTPLRLDLSDFEAYRLLPRADFIVHSAGYAQPSVFMTNPTETIQINTSATIALLKRLSKGGHFLFLSSSEVYSGTTKTVLSESDIGNTTPYHPRAAYIEGKRSGETICNAFRERGVDAKSVRLAHTYGPGTRKHDRRAINSFIEKALCRQGIDLLDAGMAVRTYLYIADATELLWRILLYGKEPLYNVGGRSVVTIAELARMIGDITGVPVTLPVAQEAVSGAPKEIRLDLTRVENEFAKTTYTELAEGLRATVEWQRGLYRQQSKRQ